MTAKQSRPAGNRAAKTSGWATAINDQGTANVVDLAAAFAAAARGCTCDYDVTGVTVGAVRHVHAAHDEWCPALGGDAA